MCKYFQKDFKPKFVILKIDIIGIPSQKITNVGRNRELKQLLNISILRIYL